MRKLLRYLREDAKEEVTMATWRFWLLIVYFALTPLGGFIAITAKHPVEISIFGGIGLMLIAQFCFFGAVIYTHKRAIKN